ncbi:hypothetical protein DSECCO2_490220 [anaerobic digester metagenome]
MKVPAAMKNGMAMIGKESMEVNAVWARYSMGRVSAQMTVARVESPREMAMGTPITHRIPKYPNRAGRGSMYSASTAGATMAPTTAAAMTVSSGPQSRIWAPRFCNRRRAMRPKPRGRTRYGTM